jgi:MFS family permease
MGHVGNSLCCRRFLLRLLHDAAVLVGIVREPGGVQHRATGSFWVAVVVLVIWAIVFAAVVPIQQASLNGIMPSEQRVTVLSFISLMGSSGAVFSQPALGRVADPWGCSVSYFVTVMVQLGALPYLIIGGTIR